MVRKKIDPEEFEITEQPKTQQQLLREYLEEFIGNKVVISSNLERSRGGSKREISLYRIGQGYDQGAQTLSLEGPGASEESPKILVTPNMQVHREGDRITLTYPQRMPFKALRQRAVPDLEVYIERLPSQAGRTS